MSLTVIRGNGVRWSGIVFRGTPFNPVAGEEKFFGVRYFFFLCRPHPDTFSI